MTDRPKSSRFRWLMLAALTLIAVFSAIVPMSIAAAQTPLTVLVNDGQEFIERDEDGEFIARPVFNRQVPLLHYGVRDADSGAWISAVYQVHGGERRHRDGWEYTIEYPVLAEQPELDPNEPYVLAILTRQNVGDDVRLFHAVIPVYQADNIWDRVIGALSPDRWARAVARWIVEGVHGTLCGVVERATGAVMAECV